MLLHTLGELRLEGSDFHRSKALLLLAYLALEGSQERQFLAHLFWPGMDNALGNLAMTLARLKKAAPNALETDTLYARATLQTDTQILDIAFSNKAWQNVLELYKGSFLQGVHSDDWGTEVEEWVYQKREAFAAKAREALLHIAEEEAKNKQFDSAAQHALKAYHLKAAPEPELEQLEQLYLLLRAGNNPHAKDVSKEAKGFGLNLHLSEEDARQRLSVPSSARFHSLPFQHTAFIGRETEKTQLAEQLRDQACRLITIVGPGGIGKTRLAIASAGEHNDVFQDGVCFVSFAAVASADLMIYTLADALELNLLGQRPPKEQVLHHLKDKKMLLILDNLEHLLSGIDLISEILVTASEIKILATSRERLDLQSEHLFDLHGLTLPDANVQHSDALRLFVERAKHNQLDFVLDKYLEDVTEICQLVGGMPLAIELAASWSRLLNPNEIMAELEGSLDLLEASTRDLPERHHSMRMVFEASWQRLSEDEQTALRKLSVFQGGFTREAALAVAQINLPTLLTLVNKSFVWRDISGRFSQHPLILQYVGHKAQEYPEEKKQTEEKHGLYYLQLVEKRAPDLRTQKAKETREVFEKERANIRASWEWTLRETRVEEIRRYARTLSYVLLDYNYYEGAEMFKRAVAVLDERNPAHHAALGYALIHQTDFALYLDDADIEASIEIIQRGLALLEPLAEYPGIFTGKNTLVILLWEQGKFAEAKVIMSATLDMAKAYGEPSDIGDILIHLALEEKELGTFSEVSVLMHTTLAELRELGDVVSLMTSLTIFGSYLVDNEKLDEGEKLIRESLALARQSGWYAHGTLADLARLAYKRHNFEEAANFAQESFERASKHANEFMKATNLAILGRVKLAEGHLVEAEQLLLESRLGWFGKKPLAVSHSLVFLAELNIARGNIKQAVTWLSFLSHYKVIEKRDRDEAVKILEKTKEQVSARDFTEAQEESKTLKLETIVAEILEKGLE
jgi:DNA-binding SARP family transcriptional activator